MHTTSVPEPADVGFYPPALSSSAEPSEYITRSQARELKKLGVGFFINHGRDFRGNFAGARIADERTLVGGGGFSSAWAVMQSGFAGPRVWQMPKERLIINA